MTTREFLNAWDRITSHGWLTMEEALLLVSWAGACWGTMVEVGSYMGRSAMLLAQIKEPNLDTRTIMEQYTVCRELHCVDPWDNKFSSDMPGDEIFKRFSENIESLPKPIRVIAHRCKAEDWKPVRAEFVYLDGDHTYQGTISQIEVARECEARVIAVHDVSSEGGGRDVLSACLTELGPWKEKRGTLAVWVVK